MITIKYVRGTSLCCDISVRNQKFLLLNFIKICDRLCVKCARLSSGCHLQPVLATRFIGSASQNFENTSTLPDMLVSTHVKNGSSAISLTWSAGAWPGPGHPWNFRKFICIQKMKAFPRHHSLTRGPPITDNPIFRDRNASVFG